MLTEPAKLKDAVLAVHEKYMLAEPLASSSAKDEREAGLTPVQDAGRR